MPKDGSNRSVSSGSRLHHPYARRATDQRATSAADIKEWEDARCAVCMEHPHNAVLLRCSSHDKGCRPYMCDTSYRHSNCLDRFRKAFAGDASCPGYGDGVEEVEEPAVKFSCPLCRGVVTNWSVVEPARRHMNAKVRICSLEACGYSGTYGELRKHARTEHPSMRPSQTDPERQRTWRRMEWQRDVGDLLSSLRPLFTDGRSDVMAEDGSGDEATDLSDGSLRRNLFYCVMIVRLHRPGEDMDPATSNSFRPQVMVAFGSRRHQRRWLGAEEVGEETDLDLAGRTSAHRRPPV